MRLHAESLLLQRVSLAAPALNVSLRLVCFVSLPAVEQKLGHAATLLLKIISAELKSGNVCRVCEGNAKTVVKVDGSDVRTKWSVLSKNLCGCDFCAPVCCALHCAHYPVHETCYDL